MTWDLVVTCQALCDFAVGPGLWWSVWGAALFILREVRL